MWAENKNCFKILSKFNLLEKINKIVNAFIKITAVHLGVFGFFCCMYLEKRSKRNTFFFCYLQAKVFHLKKTHTNRN